VELTGRSIAETIPTVRRLYELGFLDRA